MAGTTISAHWRMEDPAAFVGPEDKMRAKFRAVLTRLTRRIELFLCLPFESLERSSLVDTL